MLIDTHSHIYLEQFNDDLPETIERAKANNVQKILLPNIDSSSIESMMQLASAYPDTCYAMMGLHPTSVNETWQAELSLVEDWLAKQAFIAVGEIGIDLYWDTTFKQQQIEVFSKQIDLARKYDLPFVIHSRNSFDEVFQVLDELRDGQYKGVFHAFSGNEEQARRAIELGFKLGIGGVVSYKNAGLDKTVAAIGIDELVLETDAPYLTPVPFRGKRNESSYIKHIAEKIAGILHISVDEVADVTTKNAKQVFGIN